MLIILLVPCMMTREVCMKHFCHIPKCDGYLRKSTSAVKLATFFVRLHFKKIFIFVYLAVLGLSCGMWDLALWPGIELGPPALRAWSPSHWTIREVPRTPFFWRLILFLAVLGFPCCAQAFSSCCEQGRLSSCRAQASHCAGFSCWGAQAPELRVSSCGTRTSVAPWRVGSSWTRDHTHVSCRQICMHRTTREIPKGIWISNCY